MGLNYSLIMSKWSWLRQKKEMENIWETNEFKTCINTYRYFISFLYELKWVKLMKKKMIKKDIKKDKKKGKFNFL